MDWLESLRGLNVTCLENLSDQHKRTVLDATGEICLHLMQDLGVFWKSHPLDNSLRESTIHWINNGLENKSGLVNKRFFCCVDVAVVFTERVYEGLDMELKMLLVKYIAIAIYLDDLIDKDAEMASKAESFLLQAFDTKGSAAPPLDQYRQAALDLARYMPDSLAGNMLLHSCTTGIEGCVLEYRKNQLGGMMPPLKDAATEQRNDDTEKVLARCGFDVPLPLDADLEGNPVHLAPQLWPTWLREKSGACEAFVIPSFCAPGGVDLPVRLWVAALPEMRVFINHVNDILSFSKELLAGDSASYIAVVTKEYRGIGVPGTADDGGWCLRDTFHEAYSKVLSAASRINRLLRSSSKARYNPDGSRRRIPELIFLLQNHALTPLDREELMKALCISLWETHKEGFVCYHFQAPRYRAHQLFKWVASMIGKPPAEPEWLLSQVRR